MSTLFDNTPRPEGLQSIAPVPTNYGAPHNGSDTSRAGARKISSERINLETYVKVALWNAGRSGLTLCELTEAVTKRRGKTTKETSLTGRLDTLSGYRKDESGKRVLHPGLRWVYKTKKRRMGSAHIEITVWMHKEFWTADMGDDKS